MCCANTINGNALPYNDLITDSLHLPTAEKSEVRRKREGDLV